MGTDIFGPTNAPNSVTARPADTRAGAFTSDDTWIQDCSSASANDGTRLMAGWLNSIVGNLRSLARMNGLTAGAALIVPENNADTMIANAVQHQIQRGRTNYAADSGSANAAVVALSPAPAEYVAGLVVRLKFNATCTGATTVNVNGLGAKAVLRLLDASPLKTGDVSAGEIVEAIYDGTAFRLLSMCPSETANIVAGSRKVAIYSSPGTTSFVVPADVNFIDEVMVIGGGGGGGGAASTASRGSGGGGAGCAVKARFAVTPGASVPVVVGAGGGGGPQGLPGVNGSAGGTSSFGGTVSASGGPGGLGAANNANAVQVGNGYGSGGDVNYAGGIGTEGIVGSGGAAVFGSPGTPRAFTNANTNNVGQQPGGGGPGGAGDGGYGQPGGAGGAGIVILRYFSRY